MADDDQLVQRARGGDDEAFGALFRAHREHVVRLVHRMVGPAAEVEDLVQEVFLQVHRSLGDFRAEARFSTWLHRLTINVVLMARRSARSRPTLVDAAAAPEPRAMVAGPEGTLAVGRRVAALYRLLDRLSDKKREVFVMHDIEGLTAPVIAELVGAPALTVRTRLFYARKELAAMMRDEPALAELLPREARQSAEESPDADG